MSMDSGIVTPRRVSSAPAPRNEGDPEGSLSGCELEFLSTYSSPGPRRSSRTSKRPSFFNVVHESRVDRETMAAIKRSKLETQQLNLDYSSFVEVPTIHATEDEFANPLTIWNKYHDLGEKFGAIKVVPPPGWHGVCPLDTERMKFKVREQELQNLCNGKGFAHPPYDWDCKRMKRADDELLVSLFGSTNVSVEDVEREYWKIVKAGNRSLIVKYGADLNVYSPEFEDYLVDISGTKHEGDWWDLRNLPKCPGSLLRYCEQIIPGVNSPWLYIGMVLTSFCWHTEDNYFGAVNYHHFGAPKAGRLESVLKNYWAGESEEFAVYSLRVQVAPDILVSNGIPVHRIVQRENEFVFAWPRAFHSGLNAGYNCNEACNIAPVTWLPMGYQSLVNYRFYRKTCVSFFTLVMSGVCNYRDMKFQARNSVSYPRVQMYLHRGAVEGFDLESSFDNAYRHQDWSALARYVCLSVDQLLKERRATQLYPDCKRSDKRSGTSSLRSSCSSPSDLESLSTTDGIASCNSSTNSMPMPCCDWESSWFDDLRSAFDRWYSGKRGEDGESRYGEISLSEPCSMDTNLLNILAACMTPNTPSFVEAQRQLGEMRERQLADFVRALCDVIANPHVNSDIRQLAGVLLKNSFRRDPKCTDVSNNVLLQVPADCLHYIKVQLLNVMKAGGENQSCLAACYVISRIAELELRRHGWPEFFDIIIGMIDSNDIDACRNALTCLCYLIEDLAAVYYNQGVAFLSKAQSDRLLTSIVKGAFMSDGRSRKTVMICLQHILPFVDSNMSVPSERDTIVQAICYNSAPGNSNDVRAAANDCLVQLVTDYYDLIGPCLQYIVPLLWQAIDTGVDEIAIPAFEFWNTICEAEIVLSEDNSESNQRIIQQVISYLLPKILYTMTLHEYEDFDSESWTLPMAAGVCLSLCSQTVKNDIVPSVLQFINQNFNHAQWTHREAAVLAYGYIMEGPDADTLRMLVRDSFDRLCEVLDDPSVAVQDTAAWTIGRIASFHCQVILPHLGSLDNPGSNMSKLMVALFKPARVAANICWFLHELAEGLVHVDEYRGMLDAIFPKVCDALVRRANMDDAMERNLFSSAYNSLGNFITNASDACRPQMGGMLDHFDRMLSQSISSDDHSAESRSRQEAVCGVIQVLLTRVEFVRNQQSLWMSIFSILQDDLSEDALLTASALLNRMGNDDFTPYLSRLADIVLNGLRRPDVSSSCKACIELTSDMARVLDRHIQPYVPQLMELLLSILSDINSPQKLKPPIVTALGDLAMASGSAFNTFVEPSMRLLLQAADTSYELGPVDSEEWVWYINDLREGVLLSFTGILYGQKSVNQSNVLRGYVSSILQFVQEVVNTPDQYFSVVNYRLAVTLVGDLLTTFGSDLSVYLIDSVLMRMIIQRLKQLQVKGDSSADECREKVDWLYQSLEECLSACEHVIYDYYFGACSYFWDRVMDANEEFVALSASIDAVSLPSSILDCVLEFVDGSDRCLLESRYSDSLSSDGRHGDSSPLCVDRCALISREMERLPSDDPWRSLRQRIEYLMNTAAAVEKHMSELAHNRHSDLISTSLRATESDAIRSVCDRELLQLRRSFDLYASSSLRNGMSIPRALSHVVSLKKLNELLQHVSDVVTLRDIVRSHVYDILHRIVACAVALEILDMSMATFSVASKWSLLRCLNEWFTIRLYSMINSCTVKMGLDLGFPSSVRLLRLVGASPEFAASCIMAEYRRHMFGVMLSTVQRYVNVDVSYSVIPSAESRSPCDIGHWSRTLGPNMILLTAIVHKQPKNIVEFIVDFLCEHYPEHLHSYAKLWKAGNRIITRADPELEATRMKVLQFFNYYHLPVEVAYHFTNAGFDTLDTILTLNRDSLAEIESFSDAQWLPGHKVRLYVLFEDIKKYVDEFKREGRPYHGSI
ncbi:Importin subunit beta-1 [Babesia sp. Xinjiang]|uniref:Importin subunit beta-1 n=1 Tax=Babesia sp. Xinjiang TaxID=462227 RepID=UPI000A265F1E|nr:Importin subunit beta-1 [Babesia sp. Xinjiang]ORM40466.1 Importin subunit beta-1 [Babesia sp. Xinjiang]